jgi:hypothetical protein
MKRHKLLSGETVGPADVEARDLAFLKNLQRMAASGISFVELERVANGPDRRPCRAGAAPLPTFPPASEVAVRARRGPG